MNLAQTSPEELAGARPVAQHCAELTANGPQPEERSEHLRSWCRDLGLELAGELEQLFSGGKLQVNVSQPEMLAGRAVFEKIGPVAVNCLLRCGARGRHRPRTTPAIRGTRTRAPCTTRRGGM